MRQFLDTSLFIYRLLQQETWMHSRRDSPPPDFQCATIRSDTFTILRWRSSRPSATSVCGWPFPSVEVLHEDDFVLLLVVDELIDLGSNQQEAEATRSQTFLVANPRVFGGIIGVGDRGMVEIF
jgi:hypothetical protein